MLLKLPALVVVASAVVSSLAAPSTGSGSLTGRGDPAAADNVNGAAFPLKNGLSDDAVGLANRAAEMCGCPPGKVGFFIHGHCACSGDPLEPAYGLGQDAAPDVEDSTVAEADSAITEPNEHDLDARQVMCGNNCRRGFRAARDSHGKCDCEPVNTSWRGEKRLLHLKTTESVNKLQFARHAVRAPQEHHESHSGLEERENRDYIVVDQNVQRGPSHDEGYSKPTDACNAIAHCDKDHVPEERFNAKGESLKVCWCIAKLATGARTGAPPPSTGPVLRMKYPKRQDFDECPNIRCASGWVPMVDGSGQCTCVQNGLRKRVPPNIVFDHNVHTDVSQSGLLSLPTAKCNAKKPACGKTQKPMEHFYADGIPTGVCFCQNKVQKRQDYDECPNIRCAGGWVPKFDGSECYCALDSATPYSGPGDAFPSGDEYAPSSDLQDCSTVRCSEGYHGALNAPLGQCTCVRDGLTERASPNLVIDPHVQSGLVQREGRYSKKTDKCKADTGLTCLAHQHREERLDPFSRAPNGICWCVRN